MNLALSYYKLKIYQVSATNFPIFERYLEMINVLVKLLESNLEIGKLKILDILKKHQTKFESDKLFHRLKVIDFTKNIVVNSHDEFIEQYTNSHNLQFEYDFLAISDKVYSKFTKFTNLRVLCIENITKKATISCPTLKNLILNSADGEDEIVYNVKDCLLLENIELTGVSLETNDLSKLRNFVAKKIKTVTNILTGPLPKLIFLDIIDCEFSCEMLFKICMTAMNNLQSLVLVNNIFKEKEEYPFNITIPRVNYLHLINMNLSLDLTEFIRNRPVDKIKRLFREDFKLQEIQVNPGDGNFDDKGENKDIYQKLYQEILSKYRETTV